MAERNEDQSLVDKTTLDQLDKMKRELFRIQGPYSQHFVFFGTYEWAKKIESYTTLGCKGLQGTNTLAY
jgi:hypothetical protein